MDIAALEAEHDDAGDHLSRRRQETIARLLSTPDPVNRNVSRAHALLMAQQGMLDPEEQAELESPYSPMPLTFFDAGLPEDPAAVWDDAEVSILVNFTQPCSGSEEDFAAALLWPDLADSGEVCWPRVAAVQQGGAFSEAGISRGASVLAVNDKPVRKPADLPRLLEHVAGGDQTSIVVRVRRLIADKYPMPDLGEFLAPSTALLCLAAAGVLAALAEGSGLTALLLVSRAPSPLGLLSAVAASKWRLPRAAAVRASLLPETVPCLRPQRRPRAATPKVRVSCRDPSEWQPPYVIQEWHRRRHRLEDLYGEFFDRGRARSARRMRKAELEQTLLLDMLADERACRLSIGSNWEQQRLRSRRAYLRQEFGRVGADEVSERRDMEEEEARLRAVLGRAEEEDEARAPEAKVRHDVEAARRLADAERQLAEEAVRRAEAERRVAELEVARAAAERRAAAVLNEREAARLLEEAEAREDQQACTRRPDSKCECGRRTRRGEALPMSSPGCSTEMTVPPRPRRPAPSPAAPEKVARRRRAPQTDGWHSWGFDNLSRCLRPVSGLASACWETAADYPLCATPDVTPRSISAAALRLSGNVARVVVPHGNAAAAGLRSAAVEAFARVSHGVSTALSDEGMARAREEHPSLVSCASAASRADQQLCAAIGPTRRDSGGGGPFALGAEAAAFATTCCFATLDGPVVKDRTSPVPEDETPALASMA